MIKRSATESTKELNPAVFLEDDEHEEEDEDEETESDIAETVGAKAFKSSKKEYEELGDEVSYFASLRASDIKDNPEYDHKLLLSSRRNMTPKRIPAVTGAAMNKS